MDETQDDFKGYGEGFEGFPKRLPDDCVEYSLFVIDAKLKTNQERLAKLEVVRKEASKLTGTLLKDYIWQRDAFRLEIESRDGQMYLHGLANYGDSVEDEWLIVYILRDLSNRFPELWIQVVDTDGEFLLIEAANALPRWLNPEIADNRVWIHNNQLRIIPLTASSPQANTENAPASRTLGLDEALKIITLSPSTPFNSPMIEEEAFYRLRNYPSQISHSLHHAKLTIPRKLAYILHHLPASIAPAVEAFYLRDPISLKPLQASTNILVFALGDLITVSVKFTKVLYAQLKAQHFPPPIAWKEVFTTAEKTPSDTGSLEQLETGMKLTCGYEMLVMDPKNKDNRHAREIAILLDDLTAEGGETLPNDAEIAAWPNSNREDDEKWLDINFEDFENELQGKRDDATNKKRGGVLGAFGPELPPGFGDTKTKDDLRKMVERFEAFLNDDEAGVDGAEAIDEMDIDDDDDDDEESNSGDDEEDKDVSFDEEEFARMMREMMGMPSAEEEVDLGLGTTKSSGKGKGQRFEAVDSDGDTVDSNEEDEETEIRKVMEKMEAELNKAGALNLDPTPRKLAALKGKGLEKFSTGGVAGNEDGNDDEGSDDEVNIDFNLAKNLLESFKSQGGMAGPGGNMLGMMGIQLPRDADDERHR